DLEAHIGQRESANIAGVQTIGRERAQFEVLAGQFEYVTARGFLGGAAASVRDVDVVQDDAFELLVAHGVEGDAASSLAGTKVVPERHVGVLAAFGNHGRANALEGQVADHAFGPRRSLGVRRAPVVGIQADGDGSGDV